VHPNRLTAAQQFACDGVDLSAMAPFRSCVCRLLLYTEYAELTARQREEINAQRSVAFAPNQTFSSYILRSNVLVAVGGGDWQRCLALLQNDYVSLLGTPACAVLQPSATAWYTEHYHEHPLRQRGEAPSALRAAAADVLAAARCGLGPEALLEVVSQVMDFKVLTELVDVMLAELEDEDVFEGCYALTSMRNGWAHGGFEGDEVFLEFVGFAPHHGVDVLAGGMAVLRLMDVLVALHLGSDVFGGDAKALGAFAYEAMTTIVIPHIAPNAEYADRKDTDGGLWPRRMVWLLHRLARRLKFACDTTEATPPDRSSVDRSNDDDVKKAAVSSSSLFIERPRAFDEAALFSGALKNKLSLEDHAHALETVQMLLRERDEQRDMPGCNMTTLGEYTKLVDLHRALPVEHRASLPVKTMRSKMTQALGYIDSSCGVRLPRCLEALRRFEELCPPALACADGRRSGSKLRHGNGKDVPSLKDLCSQASSSSSFRKKVSLGANVAAPSQPRQAPPAYDHPSCHQRNSSVASSTTTRSSNCNGNIVLTVAPCKAEPSLRSSNAAAGSQRFLQGTQKASAKVDEAGAADPWSYNFLPGEFCIITTEKELQELHGYAKGVRFHGDFDIQDCHVSKVANTLGPRLLSLHVGSWSTATGHKLTDAACAVLAAKCKNLRALTLSSCLEVSDEGFESIVNGMPLLESLTMSGHDKRDGKLTKASALLLLNKQRDGDWVAPRLKELIVMDQPGIDEKMHVVMKRRPQLGVMYGSTCKYTGMNYGNMKRAVGHPHYGVRHFDDMLEETLAQALRKKGGHLNGGGGGCDAAEDDLETSSNDEDDDEDIDAYLVKHLYFGGFAG
jgi:hypothetical protein